jgi:hypothetical protein
MTDYSKLCGWKPNPDGITNILNREDNPYPDFTAATYNLRRKYASDLVDTMLYEPLVWCNPAYRRGSQAIGSCAAWGTEMAATLITAKHAMKSRSKKKFCEASTEAIYGGMRVEVPGVKRGGWSDGAFGAYGAQWVKEYGVLYRKDYSSETGNSEHDLRKYSGTKESSWGNYGCGGQNDGGKLDQIAREMPVKVISQVHSFDDVATAIAITQSPVIIGSDYGCSMRRDKNGFCSWSTSWNHLMCLGGVRFDIPGALCFQSWGPNVASGPRYPLDMPDGIAGTSWWIPARDVDRICQTGDCWAIGDYAKWKRDRTDFSKYLNRHVVA